jgi:membrane protein implicated in regulation of membrane protease activity
MVSADGHRKTADLSARELTAQLGGQLSRLVREELALAKAELSANGRQAALGGGLFASAGVVGHTAWLVMAAAAVAGISVVLPVWAAALIVGGALAVVATVLAALGRRRLRRAEPPLRMTTESVRKDVAELAASRGALSGAAANGASAIQAGQR